MPTLIDSLTDTAQTNATVKSQEAFNQTFQQASDHWIKTRRGYGWSIYSIDLTLTYSGLVEVDKQHVQTLKTRKFTPMTMMGWYPQHTLFVVESDAISPTWIIPTILSHMHPDCRLLNIIRDEND